LEAALHGPKDHFALGELLHLGADRELQSDSPDCDVIRIQLRSADDLQNGLADFLRRHAEAAQNGN